MDEQKFPKVISMGSLEIKIFYVIKVSGFQDLDMIIC